MSQQKENKMGETKSKIEIVSLKENGKVVIKNISVQFTNNKFQFYVPVKPFINPELPHGAYELIFPNGLKQKIVIKRSQKSSIPTTRGPVDVQIVEGIVG